MKSGGRMGVGVGKQQKVRFFINARFVRFSFFKVVLGTSMPSAVVSGTNARGESRAHEYPRVTSKSPFLARGHLCKSMILYLSGPLIFDCLRPSLTKSVT